MRADPRKGLQVEPTQSNATVRNEQLAVIVDRCLESEAAYKLFDMLGTIAQLDMDARLEYMELVKQAGVYSEDEVHAIGRLIISGTAHYFKEVIDQVREEQVTKEIDELIMSSR